MLPAISELFDLKQTSYADIFDDCNQAWEIVHRIGPYSDDHVKGVRHRKATIHPSAVIDDNVDIGEGTVIGPHVVIHGPTIIGRHCELRPGSFIRGQVLIGDSVIIGNSCEIKNALLFNQANIPHFNYIGDSLLGHGVHFGGGACTSNQKSDASEIVIHWDGKAYRTGMKKLGAIVGDGAELGSYTILNPGTIIGPGTFIYPGAIIRGGVPAQSIVKVRQTQEIAAKH